MDLEIIMLSEISQTQKTQIPYFLSYQNLFLKVLKAEGGELWGKEGQ